MDATSRYDKANVSDVGLMSDDGGAKGGVSGSELALAILN